MTSDDDDDDDDRSSEDCDGVVASWRRMRRMRHGLGMWRRRRRRRSRKRRRIHLRSWQCRHHPWDIEMMTTMMIGLVGAM